MANHGKDKEQVIRIDDILYVVLKHHKAMFSLAVLGLLVGLLVSFAYYVRGLSRVEYYVTASIAVTSTNQDGLFSANSSDPNASDIHLAEDITDAVIYVCKSDTTLNAASERLQLIGVSADDIKPKLTLSQYEKTQIIEMRLVWDNAEEGMMILNAITDVVPSILIDTLKIGDVSIVNPPKVHTSSLSFINPKIVAICLLLGAFAGAGFFLLKFFIHPTFLHSEDIKDAFDMDILGEIPGDKQYFNTKVNSFSASDFLSIQEYYAACAHVLVYRLQDIDNVCVYFTSSAAQEGKTSTTANVGYALAKLGYKTLLIDMDIRNPSLASKFICDRGEKHCLNAVYRGEVDVHDAVVKINSNLDLLPTRLEDTYLSLDYKILEIISNAKTEYDFVLIDTAPVGQVSDSMNINQAADCAIFIVRQNQVWVSAVTESVNRLRKSGIAILGAIMNDTKDSANTYYHDNYKQFGDSPYVHYPENEKRRRGKKPSSDNIENKRSSIDWNMDVGEAIKNKRKAQQEKKRIEAEAQEKLKKMEEAKKAEEEGKKAEANANATETDNKAEGSADEGTSDVSVSKTVEVKASLKPGDPRPENTSSEETEEAKEAESEDESKKDSGKEEKK